MVREGVPLNVFYPSSYNGVFQIPIILSEVLSADLLSETMREGRQSIKRIKSIILPLLWGSLGWVD